MQKQILFFAAAICFVTIGCSADQSRAINAVQTLVPTIVSSNAAGATTTPNLSTSADNSDSFIEDENSAPLDSTKLGKVERDVTYCAPEGVAQKLDIYYPKKSDGKPAPVAVYVHGGGWTKGDKGGGNGSKDISELVSRGYLVASINYRLAPQYKFPDDIEDVKCAIRFLRAHAAKYHLDPNRVGAWGTSAGGHLVALLGTTDASAGFDVGEYSDQSSRVQAVVDMFGPADLSNPEFFKLHAVLLAQRVFGGMEVLQRASPVTYISKDDPPFLILQGDHDKVVNPAQSQELYDKLKAAGVDATLVMVKNAGHGFSPAGGQPNPSREQITKMMADFFDRQVKNE